MSKFSSIAGHSSSRIDRRAGGSRLEGGAGRNAGCRIGGTGMDSSEELGAEKIAGRCGENVSRVSHINMRRLLIEDGMHAEWT